MDIDNSTAYIYNCKKIFWIPSTLVWAIQLKEYWISRLEIGRIAGTRLACAILSISGRTIQYFLIKTQREQSYGLCPVLVKEFCVGSRPMSMESKKLLCNYKYMLLNYLYPYFVFNAIEIWMKYKHKVMDQ